MDQLDTCLLRTCRLKVAGSQLSADFSGGRAAKVRGDVGHRVCAASEGVAQRRRGEIECEAFY